MGDQKLNITILDDASDPTAAVIAARKLVTEQKVDIIVGPSVTPSALAALDVAGESRTPMMAIAGGGAIISPLEGNRRWAFKMPPNEPLPVNMILDHMKKNGASTLGFIGFTDAYAETFLRVLQRITQERGVKLVAVERYNRTDQSVLSQVLKLQAASPDAIFVVASGTAGALPQIELARRGYKGLVYQTQAIANNDFLRVGGKDVDGAYFPVAPVLVAEQLPDSHPTKKPSMEYLKAFEGKYGPGSRSLFSASAWDVYLFIERAVPAALKSAQPGSAEFRAALRQALENTQNLVATGGVFNMNDKDHNGTDERAHVMVRIEGGKWRLVN